jgi:AraC-like DNA-binding protein
LDAGYSSVRTQTKSSSTSKQSNFVSSARIPYLNEILLHHCEQALAYRRSSAGSLRISIENAITPLLPHGKARLDAVAQTLGVSNRTLARRLTAEGLSFGEILNQLRSDLAAHYLGEANLSVSQIAWLVGYQGVSAFSHGCKRWTGMNPKRMWIGLTESRDGGRLEGGYRFGMPYGGITPYAAIQAQSFHTPNFTETDAIPNGFALSFQGRDATDTRSELGARFDRVLAVYQNAGGSLGRTIGSAIQR